MTTDERLAYRDLTIVDCVDTIDAAETRVRALQAQVADGETTAAIYRLLLLTALDALHALTRRFDQVSRERDEERTAQRRRREDVLLEAGAMDDANVVAMEPPA